MFPYKLSLQACFFCIAMLWALAALADGQPPVHAELMGLGRLQMTTQPEVAGGGTIVFQCENAAYADRLLSKLRADMTWDSLTGPKGILLPGDVPALAMADGSTLVIAERSNSVYLLTALTPSAAAQRLKKLRLTGKDTRFTPLKKHPPSLDYFDLRPLGMNFSPFNLVGQEVKGSYENRFTKAELVKAHDFWAPYGIDAHVLNGTTAFGFGGICDGPVSTYPLDYTIGLARAHGQGVNVHLGNGLAPWWMRNKFPTQITQLDPYAIPAYAPIGVSGGTWLSLTASDDAYAYVQAFTQHALDQVKQAAGDSLLCVRPLGGGRPGDEMGLHHYATEFMEYDEAGQQGFRRWLRDERKLTLADLGTRWHGDPARFQSWDQVTIPSEFEFFGGFGDKEQTMNLLTGWQWRPDRKAAEVEGWGEMDYAPGTEWTSVDLAPSMRQLLLYNNQPDDKTERIGKTAWFRKEFDATDFLNQHKGGEKYLVANTLGSQNDPVEVWLNGAYLGKIRPKVQFAGPIGMQVTALLRQGRNVLCLKVRAGIIYGPVFLTTEQPARYPNLGANRNARWVDLRDWIARRMAYSWEREALPIRRDLPDIPMMLPPGGTNLSNYFREFKQVAGLNELHDTGAFAGSYGSAIYAGLGFVDGIYMTSEEGGTMADEFAQSRQLAWMLFEGFGHHNWIYNAQSYVGFEQQTGWFSKNKRLLSLMGKALRKKPAIAILQTTKSTLYFPYSDAAISWDMGRGALQAAHFSNVYVTESEVESGAVNDFPVLFDANTTIMSDELISAIERYVRAGGTFIALHGTGRSTLTEADTWPISRLTGFKVVGERQNAMITIDKDNPLLKRLAGQKFGGSGMVINWMGTDHAKDPLPVAMQSTEADCVPLARWEDGSIAAGMRRLGKGRVITLGSSFWASKTDLSGNGYGQQGSVELNFFNDIFAGLGVVKDIDCTSEDVWARRMETKNGLQEWMLLWNGGREAVANLELTFPLNHQPSRVLDIVSGQPVKFTYRNGIVHVEKFTMARNETRVFGVDRPLPLAVPEHWLAVKAHYEGRVTPPTVKPFTPPTPDTVVLEKFRFRQIDDATKATTTWATEPLSAPAWQEVGYGFWDEMGYPALGNG
ncbi:MAG TPA: hypothetical protein VGM23_09655, partial [Armatimonadota bacterium]